jgi:hypothetical protein
MKNARAFFKSPNHGRLEYLLAAVLLATGMWTGSFLEAQRVFAQSAKADAGERNVQLMFVQTAERIRVDVAAHTFRLVNVGQQTLFFSDRPERITGHYKMDAYLKTWREGRDNFGQDPPNATLSIYEPDREGQALVVVTITNPVVDGADLIYSYKLLDGTMPVSGGATALFIDWFAAGAGTVGAPGRGGLGGPGYGAGGVGGPGHGAGGVGGPVRW